MQSKGLCPTDFLDSFTKFAGSNPFYMKKYSVFFAAALLVLAGCDKLQPKGDVLPPAEIQDKIEEIGYRLADEIEIANWKSAYNKLESAGMTFDELLDYPYDAGVLEDLDDELSDLFYDEEYEYRGGVEYYKYKSIIRLSTIKDHFTLDGKTWKRTPADDFSLTFQDPKYGEVVASMKISESSKSLIILDDSFFEEDYHGGDQVLEYHYSLYVPNSATLSISIGGETIATYGMKINFVDGDKDGMLDSDDSLKGSFETMLADYSAAADFSISFKNIDITLNAAHKSENLVSATLSLQGISTGVELSADHVSDLDEDDFSDFDCKKASFEATVLKSLKASVSAKNIGDIIDLAEEMEECGTAKEAGSYANKLEKMYDSALYIDNRKQATVGLEVFDDEDYGWFLEPVVRFEDGSSFAFFDEFFSEDRFSSVIRRFERIVEDIENLFD